MAIATKSMEVGHELPPLRKNVTLDQLRLYRGWVIRNIHTDLEIAKAAGFPAPIAQGMMSQAYLSEMLTGFFGPRWLQGGKLSVAFLRYVVPGDTITIRGTVKEKVTEGTAVKLTVEVWCENERGERVTAGTATATVS